MKNLFNLINNAFKTNATAPPTTPKEMENTEKTKHKQANPYIVNSKPETGVSIGEVLDFYLLNPWDSIEKMLIFENEHCTSITHSEEIRKYQIIQERNEKQDHLLIQIFFKKSFLNTSPLTLVREYLAEKKVYAITVYPNQNIFLKNGEVFSKPKNIYFQTNTQKKCYSQIHAELLYIVENNDSSVKVYKENLSNEEWELLKDSTKDIKTCYYQGKKAINQGVYMEAIKPLKHVFEKLKDVWYCKGLSITEMQLLTETAFWIGHACVKLEQYDQAYHYLELASRFNQDGFRYKTEFINCLVNSRNLLSILFIDDYLKEFSKNAEDPKNHDFCNFLLRRKAFLLIEMKLLEDAENILINLLNIDPENRIVIQELAYIQEEKKKQKVN